MSASADTSASSLEGLPLHLVAAAASTLILVLAAALFLLRARLGAKAGAVAGSGATAGLGSKKASEKNFAKAFEDPNKPCARIIYGTQTGTAERFAKQLAKELKVKYGDSTIIDIVDVENYQAEKLLHKEKLIIMCMATYGDGEPTDNAADFYKWLLKEAEDVGNMEKEPSLEGVSYAVFGLGNKQYEHFNSVGKKVFKSMGALGAKALIPRGDGDDDGCIDDEYEKWCQDLLQALDGRSDLVGKVSDQAMDESPASIAAYDCEVMLAGTKQAPAFSSKATGLDAQHPFMARVSAVRELHGPGSERSCVHVEVELKGSKATYEHGDHIGIYAQNSFVVVDECAALLGYPSPDKVVIVLRKPSAKSAAAAVSASLAPPPFSGPLSLRLALAYFADVLASPHKDSLRALAAFAKEPSEAQRLRRMASPEGKEDFAAYIAKPMRSLLEVMHDFPSTKPLPLGVFFATVAPRLQPRFYSISSSPALHPQQVHVTSSVVRDTMPTGRVHEGVASTWLQRCMKEAQGGSALVPAFVRHSHFKLPKDPSVPIIMVGPGTGLAPFRGFLQERASLQQSGEQLGPALLFFGCRNRAQDYLYQEELEAWLQGGVLSALDVAFSRDGRTKDYVQNHLERQGPQIWELLANQGAALYVCGDAKNMARDVNRALITLVQAGKGCSGTQAEAFVKELQDAGRYQRDVW